jgi:hypothetical protein
MQIALRLKLSSLIQVLLRQCSAQRYSSLQLNASLCSDDDVLDYYYYYYFHVVVSHAVAWVLRVVTCLILCVSMAMSAVTEEPIHHAVKGRMCRIATVHSARIKAAKPRLEHGSRAVIGDVEAFV